MTDKVDDAPKKKTWRDLIGAFDDPDSPGDVAERHDEYLGEAELREHEQMSLGEGVEPD